MVYKILEGGSLKYSDDGPGSFSGYAAVFGNRDLQGDRLVRGATLKHLDHFKRAGFISFEHEKIPIGTVEDAREDAKGLLVTGKFHSDSRSQHIRQIVRERIERGHEVAMSVGYHTISQRKAADANELTEIRIREASILSSLPANPEARVLGAKSAGGSSMTKIEQWQELKAKAEARRGVSPSSWSQALFNSVGWKESKWGGRSTKLIDIDLKAAGDPIEQTQFSPLLTFLNLTQHVFKPGGILQMISRTTVDGPLIVYSQNTYPLTNATTFVAEGASKLEVQPRWTTTTARLEEVSDWTGVTSEALADLAGLRQIVDVDLAAALNEKIADRVINGTGTTPDILGILAMPNIQTVPFVTSTNVLDMIFKGINTLQASGYSPNGIVLSPPDDYNLNILKTTAGAYAMDPNLPVVAVDAHLPAGTALVGDWRFSTLYQRGTVRFETGFKNDDILRNIFTIAVSSRVALGVSQQQSICKTLLA
jgi:HK97 family phage prohead protease